MKVVLETVGFCLAVVAVVIQVAVLVLFPIGVYVGTHDVLLSLVGAR